MRSWLRSLLRGKSEDAWRETIEELIEDGEEGEDDASVARHERVLLGNILRLRGRTAIDVMVPRADIVGVEVDTPLPGVLDILAREAHSRMPVYRDNLDDALGMIHVKDVVSALSRARGGDGDAPKSLTEILRPVQIVAPSMPVLDLLLQMREKRQHMALVIDEFGGIDGLITIEDLVEEIVGEIEDEHDIDEPPQLVEKPDGTLIADARLPIEAFEAKVGAVLEEDERDDIDTLGGLVFALAGRIPARGELLTHPKGFEFEVIDADPRRIKRLRIRRKGGADAA
ncbi:MULTISPECIES: hemolysin family protein [Inquilinus]|uniref:CBS domain containing-hemolysin-like protein n=1 Tax=Inquilinus ginsengisoli TaxID=363840 RepID=A0ABU1K1M8_9PROT|nr:hemolysin family protein [Inquilinus ginsengisoli]MDR6293730.1 CBS domain containing-hemolysin-like protein [Inquilinus ginsengisoli]